MKNKSINSTFGFASIVLLSTIGCAHTMMRGSVVMKDTNQEAHVYMEDKEVHPGDRVTLFNTVCRTQEEIAMLETTSSPDCQKVKIGGGIVQRNLNDHFSIVKVDPGVEFKEGTVVEKG